MKKEGNASEQIWSRFFHPLDAFQKLPPPIPPPPHGDPVDNIRCRSRGTSISWLAGWSRSLVDSKINYSSVHRKCTSILSWPLVCFSSATRIVAQSGVGIGVPFEVDQLTAADESRDGWPRPTFFFLLSFLSFLSLFLFFFFLSFFLDSPLPPLPRVEGYSIRTRPGRIRERWWWMSKRAEQWFFFIIIVKSKDRVSRSHLSSGYLDLHVYYHSWRRTWRTLSHDEV